MRQVAGDADPWPPLELRPQRPVADERQRPSPSRRRRSRAGRRSCARSASRRRRTPARPGCPLEHGNRSRSTPQSTTSVFAAGCGYRGDEPPGQPLGDCDHRRRAFTTCWAGGRTYEYCVRSPTSCPCAVTTSGARAARPASSPRSRSERGSGRRRYRAGSAAPPGSPSPRASRGEACRRSAGRARPARRRALAHASSRSSPWTKTPKSGASGDGYIWETSRMRTGASSRFSPWPTRSQSRRAEQDVHGPRAGGGAPRVRQEPVSQHREGPRASTTPSSRLAEGKSLASSAPTAPARRRR